MVGSMAFVTLKDGIRRDVGGVDNIYWSVELFVEDLKADTLKEEFVLSEDVFRDLCIMVNTDKALADEIAGAAVLLLLASKDKGETEGLIAIAEVCRGG